jgi:hypothetical protein
MDLHLVVARRTANASKLFRVDGKRVLAVLLQHRQRLLVVDLPHPVRVARKPDFRESDELTSNVTGLLDEGDGLLYAGSKIEPAWLGGDDGGFVLGKRHVGSLGDRVFEFWNDDAVSLLVL